MATLLQDLRYGIRILVKNPGFTAVAVLTLALGIGANTAIFTLVDAVMLRMLPVRNPEQLVLLKWVATTSGKLPYRGYSGWTGCPDTPGARSGCSFSYPGFEQFRRLDPFFSEAFALVGPFQMNMTVNGRAGLAIGELVSGQFFSTLGVAPLLGRDLNPSDDAPEAQPACVISYGFWDRRFGRKPSVVGTTVTLNSLPFTIVGVTPPEFFGVQAGWEHDLWLPLARMRDLKMGQYSYSAADPWWVQVIGRLRPGAVAEQARAAAEVVFRQGLSGAVKDSAKDLPRIELVPAKQGLYTLRSQYSRPLLLLMALVGLVLLIACANVANLSLARAMGRQTEIAVRLSVGASRARLVRQLLTESLLLALVGAAAGLLIAEWAANFLVAMMSTGWIGTLALAVRPDISVLAFTGAVSVLTAALFGLAPALLGTGVELAPALKGSSAVWPARSGLIRAWLGRGLVVSQVALSLLLLVGAGLFERTMVNLEKENLGFNRRNLLLFRLDPGLSGYKSLQAQSLYKELLDRIQSLPGVTSVSFSHTALMSRSYNRDSFSIADQSFHNINVLWVGPQFFETMEVPLLMGRRIGPQDESGTQPVAVINEAFARRFTDHPNPAGLRLRQGEGKNAKEIEIVGVVANAKYDQIREAPPPTVYLPYLQSGRVGANFEVRTAGEPSALIPAIRRVVDERAKDVPLSEVKTQEEQIAQTLFLERLLARVSGFLSLLAVLVAAVGVYGLISYSAERRTHEIGVRVALGARREDVLKLVVGQGVRLALMGVAIGITGALALSRVLASLLYRVKPSDPATFVTVSVVLTAVALAASYVPARRATKVDPVEALRYE